MGILNFAQGALTTYGAYFGAAILGVIGITTGGPGSIVALIGAAIGVFIALTVFGAGIELTLIRKIYDRPAIDQILLTFGLALVLESFLKVILDLWNIQPFQQWLEPQDYGPEIVKAGSNIELGAIGISGLKLFEFVVAVIVVGAVWLFLTRTRYGLYIRAGTEDNEMAEALGIRVRRVFTLVFGLGIGLTGLAGLFMIWEPKFQLTLSLGHQVLLPAFIVVVVGGLGTYKGTVVASVIAGIFAEFGNMLFVRNVSFLGFEFGGISTLPQMLLFILLVVMLIVKPTGLYGQEEVGGH
jgi:branched-chain amino acid transport system permease protein